MSLRLENLPVFYQLLLSEINTKNQEKINDKISQYQPIQTKNLTRFYHPSKKGLYSGVQALANTLLDLRSNDEEFKSKAITRYLSFKFSLQLDLVNEWHKIKISEFERDFYLYFNALSLFDEKKYQQAVNTIESIIINYDISTPNFSMANLLFLIDTYNLYILSFIFLENYNKAQFELFQLFFMIEKLSKYREIYFSNLYLAKHKELLIAILKEDKNKIHNIIRGFNNNKSEIKDYYSLGMFNGLLALYYIKEQDYNKIEELLVESGHQFEQFGSDRLVTSIYYNIASFKLQQGDLHEAVIIFEDKYDFFLSQSDIISSIKFAILFSEIYLSLNDVNKSLNQLQWIIQNSKELYRIREVDYWLLLHSLAERHDHEELRGITNDKIEVLFLSGNVNEKLIYVYNVRKTALIDYSRGDFEKASKKLSVEKTNLINMNLIGFLFDINLDLMRSYLKQFEFSKNKSVYSKIITLFDDMTVYIKSTKSIEAQIFLLKAKINFLLSANEFKEVSLSLSELLIILKGQKTKNKFIESLFIETSSLEKSLKLYSNSKFFLLISDLNKFDLSESINSIDIFVPKNNASIEEIWRHVYIRNSLISISTIRIQRINKFDLQELNINRIPGLIRYFE